MQAVQTKPEIPTGTGKQQGHPDFQVDGPFGYCMGHLIYKSGQAAPDGYRFHANNSYCFTLGTMEQIAEKIRQADAAVKNGLI